MKETNAPGNFQPSSSHPALTLAARPHFLLPHPGDLRPWPLSALGRPCSLWEEGISVVGWTPSPALAWGEPGLLSGVGFPQAVMTRPQAAGSHCPRPPSTHLQGEASIGLCRSRVGDHTLCPRDGKRGGVLSRQQGELLCLSREFWSSSGYPGQPLGLPWQRRGKGEQWGGGAAPLLVWS